jgi:hypothetical protein
VRDDSDVANAQTQSMVGPLSKDVGGLSSSVHAAVRRLYCPIYNFTMCGGFSGDYIALWCEPLVNKNRAWQCQAETYRFIYGHGIGPELQVIFALESDPLLGALGSVGAHATIGPGDSGCAQLNTKGCVVRVYSEGGGA